MLTNRIESIEMSEIHEKWQKKVEKWEKKGQIERVEGHIWSILVDFGQIQWKCLKFIEIPRKTRNLPSDRL